jgi:hypothetical protein
MMHYAELVAAPSSFEFAQDGIHAVTRDYMHTALWDVRRPAAPVRMFQVHPHLWERLPDVYENECIFDRLGCAVSPRGDHVVAGAYGELAVFNTASEQFSLLKTCVQPFTANVRSCPMLVHRCMHACTHARVGVCAETCARARHVHLLQGLTQRPEPFPVNYKWKVENVAWHPSHHLVVATSLNSLFTFCARPPSL